MTAPARRFAPWPVPAGLLFAAGIAIVGAGLPAAWLLLAVPAAAVFRLVGWPRWVLLLALLAPLGALRYQAWDARPNPLAGSFGQVVTVSGRWDGRYLRLDAPLGARVALVAEEAPPPGRVSVRGELVRPPGKRNPGGFDYGAYLRRRGVDAQLFLDEVLSVDPAPAGPRERLRRGVAAGLGERPALLMQAMTLGIKDDIDDLRDIFAASGLAHLLALSGLHVGVLVAALGLLLAPLGQWRYPVLIALCAAFAFLVGVTPSVLRASAMTTAVLLSLWLGGGRLESWPALALSALFVLAWNPSWLFDLSFQLSYLCVAGILLLSGPLVRLVLGPDHGRLAWWHPGKFLAGGLAVSVAAQAFSLPLVLSTFGQVPLFGPLANLAAVPLATLLVPLGFAAGLLGLLWQPLAAVLNVLTGAVASLLIGVADAAARLPQLNWSEIGPPGYAAYALAMAALVLMLRGHLRPYRALLVVLAAMSASTLGAPSQGAPEVVFLDVGQGDAALIRLEGRREILVDGGGTPFSDFDIGAETVMPALWALGVDELELVVATHADADHIEGLLSVLEMMPVQELVVGGSGPGGPMLDRLVIEAEKRGVRVVPVLRGQSLLLGDARLDVLNPPRHAYEAGNDNSVGFVLRLDGAARGLFLGDASTRAEAGLAFPDVDVLMVPHHGSRSSTSNALLEAARPEAAVISYGRNGYGHPAPEALARLRAHGVEVHETHEEGAVRLPLE